jgi:hypothetical protein
MTSPISETAEELVRRARLLASRVEPKCSGNGTYDREYKIGEVTLAIDGWWGADSKDWNKEYDTGLCVELGEVEILDARFGDGQIQVQVDPSVVERVLEVVRQHMIILENDIGK